MVRHCPLEKSRLHALELAPEVASLIVRAAGRHDRRLRSGSNERGSEHQWRAYRPAHALVKAGYDVQGPQGPIDGPTAVLQPTRVS